MILRPGSVIVCKEQINDFQRKTFRGTVVDKQNGSVLRIRLDGQNETTQVKELTDTELATTVVALKSPTSLGFGEFMPLGQYVFESLTGDEAKKEELIQPGAASSAPPDVADTAAPPVYVYILYLYYLYVYIYTYFRTR